MTARWTAQMDTPVGLLTVETTENAVAEIRFGGARTSATPGLPTGQAGRPAIMKKCLAQLNEYFAGKRTRFDDLPMDVDGTEFQKNVWETARKIGYGATLTYGGLACAMGEDGAARAVGNALNKNPVCVIVPCHRVVRSGYEGGLPAEAEGRDASKTYAHLRQGFGGQPSAKVGGYAGGMERKQWLLRHENIRVSE